MQEHDDLNPELAQVAESLKALVPSTAEIDPIIAAFDAGRRSVRKPLRFWQSIAAVILLALVGTTFRSSHRAAPTSPAVVQLTPVPPIESANPTPLPRQSWLALQNTVAKDGVNALPMSDIPSDVSLDSEKSPIE
jgi:hypothetical protein